MTSAPSSKINQLLKKWPTGAVAGAVTVMFTYVVPKIVATFKELNQTLPLPTQILIAASDWVQAWWPGIIVGVLGVVFAVCTLALFLNSSRRTHQLHTV